MKKEEKKENGHLEKLSSAETCSTLEMWFRLILINDKKINIYQTKDQEKIESYWFTVVEKMKKQQVLQY